MLKSEFNESALDKRDVVEFHRAYSQVLSEVNAANGELESGADSRDPAGDYRTIENIARNWLYGAFVNPDKVLEFSDRDFDGPNGVVLDMIAKYQGEKSSQSNAFREFLQPLIRPHEVSFEAHEALKNLVQNTSDAIKQDAIEHVGIASLDSATFA